VRFEFNVDKPLDLPAYVAERAPDTRLYNASLPIMFISPTAAANLGLGTYTTSAAVTYPSSSDVDALRTAAEDAGVNTHVEESSASALTYLYLALAGVAGLVALLGAGVTVALSATDGRADLATLAALGAQPRRRRTLAGTQALVVTGLGTLTGLALGGCVGYAAVPLVNRAHLVVPWQHLWLTAVAVPLLAAVVAVLATPSRLPMIQRRQS
jgi:putative ABC transport system permease protein